jgi:hypothetical protein
MWASWLWFKMVCWFPPDTRAMFFCMILWFKVIFLKVGGFGCE